ncbi:bestrophin-like domain [Labrys wisconsinensis]|uniref:DUF4239 domain-containing protein n=1 Tax=Labrys wisconsinensis TaxID=425677 RepID=A0ABU0JE27_9HYPH|nr:hypothetical protein [Labrys wisconsinensis]MDQ0471870.1 hypothetical protein [Labrys wisconsinensis]
MPDVLSALVYGGLLSVSALGGVMLRGWLREEHLSDRNLEAVRLVTQLLVTFVALVLSLQLTSVKASFDIAYRDRGLDAAALAQLDRCLRDYGPETAPARALLRDYTAGVIASTWPGESLPAAAPHPDPAGMARVGEDPRLAALLNRLGLEVRALVPAEAARQNIAAACRAGYDRVQERRWMVIEDAHGSLSSVFTGVLMFWLMLVFLSLGLQAPRKPLAGVAIGIGVVAVASVIWVIADLDLPYGGLFGIPSTAMLRALDDMLR